MKQGKHICETLKAIRQEIANANDIDYSPTPCNHNGDCAGTCPVCESETRWIERQLRTRQALGKAVTIAGLSLAMSGITGTASASSLGIEQSKATRSPQHNNEVQTDGYVQKAKQELVRIDNDTTVYTEDVTDGIVPIYRKIEKPVLADDYIYTAPDEEATFPGGDEALLQLIKESIKIPDEILEPLKELGGSVKARCIVKCVIEADGSVGDAVIEKTTTAPLFDNEALRVVKSLPKFTPARVYNSPVRSWAMIPVEFVLDFSGKD